MILSPPIEIAPTLLSAPWGYMLPRSADLVVEGMRALPGFAQIVKRHPELIPQRHRELAAWISDGFGLARGEQDTCGGAQRR